DLRRDLPRGRERLLRRGTRPLPQLLIARPPPRAQRALPPSLPAPRARIARCARARGRGPGRGPRCAGRLPRGRRGLPALRERSPERKLRAVRSGRRAARAALPDPGRGVARPRADAPRDELVGLRRGAARRHEAAAAEARQPGRAGAAPAGALLAPAPARARTAAAPARAGGG